MLNKLLTAGSGRKSRLHDEKGNFIGVKRLLINGPRAILSGILRITISHRPELPWISYSAIEHLNGFLNESSRVLEFGSGMSTIWYSQRAREVCSVEENRPWFDKIERLISSRNVDNIHLEFHDEINDYSNFMAGDHQGFDLIMVDGNYRSACINSSMSLLKPGGILYFDNSDRGTMLKDDDTRIAEQLLLEFAKKKQATVTYFTDFAPTTFFVQQGLMLQLPM